MIKALTLFPASSTPEAFEQTLTPLVASLKEAPGFISVHTSNGHLMSPGGPPPYSKVIEFSFDTLGNFLTWAQSSPAQAQKEGMKGIGPVMMYYEVKEL